MKIKKFFTFIISGILALSLISCSSKYDSTTVRQYSDNITKNILNSMADLNYEGFSKKLDNTMKELTPDNAAFLNLVMPIQNAVGTYEKNSLEFVEAEVQKGTINVLYKAKFTNEDEPVRISISFKEDDPDHKVCGLLFNSPKIEELSKENK